MTTEASSVYLDMRKWKVRPHYRFHGTRLGEDQFGTWVAVTKGTTFTGPVSGRYPVSFVGLVPWTGWYLATWWDLRHAGIRFQTYVDITTPPVWFTPNHVGTIDLDLDVIRDIQGRVFIDDEDEFDDHRARYGYPDDVVAEARASVDAVAAAMREGAGPFGGAWERWFSLALLRESIDVP
jgi:uncharacterized protein